MIDESDSYQWTKEELARLGSIKWCQPIKYNRKETKMTRQEAIDKFKTASGHLHGSPIIDGLEALGLIKFEKENTPLKILSAYMSDADEAILELQQAGYSIVRNKP